MSNAGGELDAKLAKQKKEIADRYVASNLALLRLVQHHCMVASVRLEIIQVEDLLQAVEALAIPECLRAPRQSPLETIQGVGVFDPTGIVEVLRSALLSPRTSVASAHSAAELRSRLVELRAVESALQEASHQRCH